MLKDKSEDKVNQNGVLKGTYVNEYSSTVKIYKLSPDEMERYLKGDRSVLDNK